MIPLQEQSLALIEGDELAEVTPKSIGPRKRLLTASERARSKKDRDVRAAGRGLTNADGLGVSIERDERYFRSGISKDRKSVV